MKLIKRTNVALAANGLAMNLYLLFANMVYEPLLCLGFLLCVLK